MLFALSKMFVYITYGHVYDSAFWRGKKSQSHKDKAKMKNAIPHIHSDSFEVWTEYNWTRRQRKKEEKRTNETDETEQRNGSIITITTRRRSRESKKKQYLMGNQSEMYDRLINNIMWYSLQRVWNAHDYTTLFFLSLRSLDFCEGRRSGSGKKSQIDYCYVAHNSQVKRGWKYLIFNWKRVKMVICWNKAILPYSTSYPCFIWHKPVDTACLYCTPINPFNMWIEQKNLTVQILWNVSLCTTRSLQQTHAFNPQCVT